MTPHFAVDLGNKVSRTYGVLDQRIKTLKELLES